MELAFFLLVAVLIIAGLTTTPAGGIVLWLGMLAGGLFAAWLVVQGIIAAVFWAVGENTLMGTTILVKFGLLAAAILYSAWRSA